MSAALGNWVIVPMHDEAGESLDPADADPIMFIRTTGKLAAMRIAAMRTELGGSVGTYGTWQSVGWRLKAADGRWYTARRMRRGEDTDRGDGA